MQSYCVGRADFLVEKLRLLLRPPVLPRKDSARMIEIHSLLNWNHAHSHTALRLAVPLHNAPFLGNSFLP